MSSRTLSLTDPIYDYLVRVSLRETDVQRRLREETATLENAAMQVSPEQGQFMSLLVRVLGAERALEIGVFTGYSTLCVALAMPQGGRVVACDVSEAWTAIGRRYWREAGVDDRIDLRIGPAIETLGTLLDDGAANTFDIAFIDADKPGYLSYYELALSLVRRGGLILVDNVLWGGRVCDPDADDADTVAIRELNRVLHDDERVDLSLVPIGDGLTILRRR